MDFLYNWIPPEKAHLALAMLPLHGLLVATLSLLLATAIGRRGVLIVSLILVVLTSASVLLVVDANQAARAALESQPATLPTIDQPADDRMDLYQARLEFWSRPILAITVLAVIALGLAAWRPRDIGRYAGGIMSLLCIAGIAAMAWVANAGINAYASPSIATPTQQQSATEQTEAPPAMDAPATSTDTPAAPDTVPTEPQPAIKTRTEPPPPEAPPTDTPEPDADPVEDDLPNNPLP
ncbi:MAG: hypothetical protein AAF842_01420 [Planctomycetota bacterium]